MVHMVHKLFAYCFQSVIQIRPFLLCSVSELSSAGTCPHLYSRPAVGNLKDSLRISFLKCCFQLCAWALTSKMGMIIVIPMHQAVLRIKLKCWHVVTLNNFLSLVCCSCYCDNHYGSRPAHMGLFMGPLIAPHRAQVCTYLECPSPFHMHQFLQVPLLLLRSIIALLCVPEHLPLNVFDSLKNKVYSWVGSFMFALLP